MEIINKSRFEFEDYVLLPSERLLKKNNEVVLLKPKVFDTLLTLVRHNGKLLSKEDLIQLIWEGRSVEEGNLSQYIFTLRKIFGENPHDHRFIVTIPGQGYRFVAKVFEVSEDSNRNYSPETTRSAGRQIRSLAVLPLNYLRAQEDEDFFGLAAADTLITRLSTNRNISIRSTAAIIKYAYSKTDPIAIGRELNVDAIMSGTMIKCAEKIILNIQLTNIFNRELIWANKFEAAASNFLETHDQIAEQVAEALAIELHQNEKIQGNKPDNQEVYQTYLKGRYFWNKRSEAGLEKGLACAEEVIAAEPDFALGYIGIADSYLLLGEYLFAAPENVFPKARAAAEKALKITPGLAEGYASLAEYFFYYEKDWTKAEDFFRRAIKLNPTYACAIHWYTWLLFGMGRFDEALAQIEQAQHIDNSSILLSTIRGLPFYYKRDFDRAIIQFRRILEAAPELMHARYYLGSALVHAGDTEAAITEFKKCISAEPVQQAIALLGYCLAVSGDHLSARNQLRLLDEIEQRRYVSPYVRAIVHTGLDETRQALTLLERAFKENAAWIVWLAVDPFFDKLHNEPRFQNLLEKLNLS